MIPLCQEQTTVSIVHLTFQTENLEGLHLVAFAFESCAFGSRLLILVSLASASFFDELCL